MKQGPERELVARYLDRAVLTGKPLGLTGFAVTELVESRASSGPSRKADEARAIGEHLPNHSPWIALDEHGKSIGSDDFAQKLARWRDDGKPTDSGRRPKGARVVAMDLGLRRAGRRSRYRLRKQIVEPVFGQIKAALGFASFLLRGLRKVRGEWRLVATAHNLRKLIAAGA
jgi:hypothetical protein